MGNEYLTRCVNEAKLVVVVGGVGEKPAVKRAKAEGKRELFDAERAKGKNVNWIDFNCLVLAGP